MILCTNCGTKNPDDAQACEKCGRKLQSRWAAAPAPGQNGNGKPAGPSILPEPVWQLIEPIIHGAHGVDESAAKLVKACAETWAYALILLAGAGLYLVTEDWLFLAGGVVIAAVMAWVRGI